MRAIHGNPVHLVFIPEVYRVSLLQTPSLTRSVVFVPARRQPYNGPQPLVRAGVSPADGEEGRKTLESDL